MTQAVGTGIKKAMVSLYDIAHAAEGDGTQDGAALARQWKRLYAEYAVLSARYLALAKQMAKLRLEPDQVVERYDALDKAFDELQDRMEPLSKDLKTYHDGGGGDGRTNKSETGA
jgi:predicted nuclease with TOPRIM domain